MADESKHQSVALPFSRHKIDSIKNILTSAYDICIDVMAPIKKLQWMRQTGFNSANATEKLNRLSIRLTEFLRDGGLEFLMLSRHRLGPCFIHVIFKSWEMYENEENGFSFEVTKISESTALEWLLQLEQKHIFCCRGFIGAEGSVTAAVPFSFFRHDDEAHDDPEKALQLFFLRKGWCRRCNRLPNPSQKLHFMFCNGCGLVKYCSRECQLDDWKRHSKECRRLDKIGKKPHVYLKPC